MFWGVNCLWMRLDDRLPACAMRLLGICPEKAIILALLLVRLLVFRLDGCLPLHGLLRRRRGGGDCRPHRRGVGIGRQGEECAVGRKGSLAVDLDLDVGPWACKDAGICNWLPSARNAETGQPSRGRWPRACSPPLFDSGHPSATFQNTWKQERRWRSSWPGHCELVAVHIIAGARKLTPLSRKPRLASPMLQVASPIRHLSVPTGPNHATNGQVPIISLRAPMRLPSATLVRSAASCSHCGNKNSWHPTRLTRFVQ